MRPTLEDVHNAYEQMKPLIIRKLRYIKPAWVSLDDIWQDILLDGIIKVPERYDASRSSLTTFVVWVARSYISNLSKKWTRYKETGASDDCDPAALDSEHTLDIKRAIFKITDELDPKKRLVVRYRYEGFTEEEIGQRFNFTKQRVNELFQRASEDIQDNYTLEEVYELASTDLRTQ